MRVIPAICALLWSSSAAAYNFYDEPSGSDPAKWTSNSVGLSINTNSFPLNGALFTPINDAIEAWDNDDIPGSALGVSAGSIGLSLSSNNDNVNMVLATDLGDCEPGNIGYTDARIPAQFLAWGGNFEEADIVFNSNCTYTTGTYYDAYDELRSLNIWDIRQLVIHETGHAVGLEHEGGEYALGPSVSDGVAGPPEIYDYQGFPVTMEAWTSGGAFIGDLGYLSRQYNVNEDDREGIRELYPTGLPATPGDHDVALQSYFTPDEDTIAIGFKGNSCHNAIGERSRPHPRVDLFEIAMDAGLNYGACPPDFADVPPPLYTDPPDTLPVIEGSSISAVFTLLDLGLFTEEEVSFRVMLTQSIGATCPSSTCFVLEDSLPTVSVNTPYERTSVVTIPDAPGGIYYLVAEIDYTHDIDERNEYNNVAVWNRKIRVIEEIGGCECRTGPRPGAAWLAVAACLILIRRRRG